MSFARLCLAIAGASACLLPTGPWAGESVSRPDANGFVRIAPAQMNWVSAPGGHGAQFATVMGDPSKPGLYVMRAKFPPHWMDTPHSHSQDRYVTVLEGTWYTGTGPIFEAAKAVPLGPGS